jgi:hypothetical protein|tara:strand:+ start:500 stop:694 length:195 start_codon:yes stop_codon:yes gene_type:complete
MNNKLHKEIREEFNIDILDLPAYQIGIIEYFYNDMNKSDNLNQYKNKGLKLYDYIREVIKNVNS